jgi:hypothetical protein
VDRTYVFGDWERRLLVESSAYQPEGVVVSGSPRLDLDGGEPGGADRERVRAELGVRPGDRMLVVSGSNGALARHFWIATALAAILDRPLPRVHLVAKLHPNEPEDGLYGRLIPALAAARGFAPPPVTTIKRIDLYRLLRAADAHLGVHSTVLTEAVAAGTGNLIATSSASSDLLDYVAAGVALPVRSGADLLAALDALAAGAITDESRARFLADHFRPGNASARIRDDLLAWVPLAEGATTAFTGAGARRT